MIFLKKSVQMVQVTGAGIDRVIMIFALKIILKFVMFSVQVQGQSQNIVFLVL